MLGIGMIMRPYWPFLRSTALLGTTLIALTGCDSVLTPFVGQSKDAAAKSAPQAPPPGPPPSAAFVSDSTLSPGYVGHTILPPTLPTVDTDDDADDTPAAPSGPRHAIVAVPLSADPGELITLSAAVKREAAPANVHFVLLVLSSPAADAAALDKTNSAARQAAAAAIKMLGDAGISADRIEVSMATSPNAGKGELRLYRR